MTLQRTRRTGRDDPSVGLRRTPAALAATLLAATAVAAPATAGLAFSTYLGSSGSYREGAYAVTVDAGGAIYVTGTADAPDFPIQGSSRTMSGRDEAFVTKLTPAGDALVYSTFIGGGSEEFGYDIKVDAGGNAHVFGTTGSGDFPVVVGAFQPIYAGGLDTFVLKLDATGSALVFSTYLGGGGTDEGLGLALDDVGNVYVTGQGGTGFPLKDPLPGSAASGAYLAELDPSGSSLLFSTFLAGTYYGWGVAVDAARDIHVVGQTTGSTLPRVNAVQTTPGGGMYDAFVMKIRGSDHAIVFSTYLGGGGDEGIYGLVLDPAGLIYVAGSTESANFPTANALQAVLRGTRDGFVAGLDPGAGRLVFSTYFGGSGGEDKGWYGWGKPIARDAAGDLIVAGTTDSTDFPVSNAIQPALGGKSDAFVASLAPDGSAIRFATYLGGADVDGGRAIAADATGGAVLVGETNSTNFPTRLPFQPANHGAYDTFVARLAGCARACCVLPAVAPPAGVAICAGGTARLDASGSTLSNCAGSATYQWHEGATPLGGETGATFDVPATAPPGTYAYSVEVGCDAVPGCTARSREVAVRVEAPPAVPVLLVQGVRRDADVAFQWTLEPSASGGYRLYRTADKALVASARAGMPRVDLAATTAATPADAQASDAGAVSGPPLLFYQVVALCAGGSLEGPN